MRVAIGKAATPATRAVLRLGEYGTGRPSGPYGSYVLGLSGFSEAIEPGPVAEKPRLAIHGPTIRPTPATPSATGASRVPNRLLRVLHDVPMGTPVRIRP